MFRNTIDVMTPERVTVELVVAGVGSRAIAYLIDVSLIFFSGIVIYFGITLYVTDPINVLLALSRIAQILGVGAVLVALWSYWTISEVLWHGQTIGKRLMKIRVVRLNGAPVTTVYSAVRNLFRLVDFLPVAYPVGIALMLFDAKNRRVGDFVAGTVLVREESIDLSRYIAHAPAAPALSPQEFDVFADFLQRFDSLDPTARISIGRRLLARLGIAVDALDEKQVRAHLETQFGSHPSKSQRTFFT